MSGPLGAGRSATCDQRESVGRADGALSAARVRTACHDAAWPAFADVPTTRRLQVGSPYGGGTSSSGTSSAHLKSLWFRRSYVFLTSLRNPEKGSRRCGRPLRGGGCSMSKTSIRFLLGSGS